MSKVQANVADHSSPPAHSDDINRNFYVVCESRILVSVRHV